MIPPSSLVWSRGLPHSYLALPGYTRYYTEHMSDRQKKLMSSSTEKTLEFARHIGRRLKGGEVIELISDLGGGKTTFVKGLAAGFGSKDPVRSPTFTIVHEYKSGDLTLHHFDFYRLGEAGIMQDELAETLSDSNSVVAIEWGRSVHQILPEQRLKIGLTNAGENSRELFLAYPEQLAYLISGLED